MKFDGEYKIDAEPVEVWKLLNDPDVLYNSIPGCEELVHILPDTYDAIVSLKVGVIKARFKGQAKMTEQQPPDRCVIAFQGSGGIAGMVRGEAHVVLLPVGHTTLLRYVADVVIGGKIAQIGSKLIEGTARKTADQFFNKFANYVSMNANP